MTLYDAFVAGFLAFVAGLALFGICAAAISLISYLRREPPLYPDEYAERWRRRKKEWWA